jgi:predicted component of type VI protein secretion system
VQEGATQRFDDPGNIPISTRWGTSRLGAERKLLLHVRNTLKPLEVCLTDKLVLGRFDTETGEAPDVDLAQYGARDSGVSRRHAMIMLEDETLKIVDLGSANATYLNGQKMMARQARILRDGDEIRLGKMTIHVHFT